MKILFLMVMLFYATSVFAQKMDQPARWGQIQGKLADQSDISAEITNLNVQIVSTTQVVIYAAAPVSYGITITNTSAITWTNTWSPTSTCSSATFTGTGVVTHVYEFPSNLSCSLEFLLTATGMPTMVFPTGARWYTNGVFSETAGTIGKSNLVVVKHTPYLYLMYAITNAQTSTWGTP